MLLKSIIKFKNFIFYLCFLLQLLLLSCMVKQEEVLHEKKELSKGAEPHKLVTQGTFPSIVMVSLIGWASTISP